MRLVVEKGAIEFDGEYLIRDINFEVKENSKIAIIGQNGCGKTSLLRAIEGEIDFSFERNDDHGTFVKSNDFEIGYLKQIGFKDENRTLEEEILTCYEDIINLKKKLDSLEKEMIENATDKVIEEYTKTHDYFETMGGYYYQKDYRFILKKFGFTEEELNKPLKNFSGGEKTKISFIKLLISKPDLLILDEPTNHLDIEAVEWLEEYLKNYKKSFIVVSHDREFINKVAKTIYEIDNKTVYRYTGNYDDYLIQKDAMYKHLEKEYQKQKKEIEHNEELIKRFRYKATKAKMVQSRIKMLDKMDVLEQPKMPKKKTFKMDINPTNETGKEVLNISNLEVGYNMPLAKLSLLITKGDKIGIIGENGTGKSTLLKTLVGEIKPISGEFKYGFNVRKGYFDQQVANKVSSKTIIDDYKSTYPFLLDREARNDLGAFLFSGKDTSKRLDVLSGGELVRYNLCKLFKTKPNLLILDEPTNHMDIYSKEAIEKMLLDYKGSVLVVSHDRYFIRKIAKSLLVFENGGVSFYEYGYNEYLAKRENKKFEIPETKKVIKTYVKENRGDLKKELNKLEKEINEKEEAIKAIQAEYEKEEVYSDFMLTQELEEREESIDDELQVLLRKWEEVMRLLEEEDRLN